MFCHKCGAQIAEEADFCHQCGTKVIHTDNAPAVSHPSPTMVETGADPKQTPDSPIQTTLPEADNSGFKAFVDNHIQKVTDFQSAEELLGSKVSLRFLWICLGVAALLGLITLNPILLLFFLLLGYAAARVICGVKKGRCAFRYQGKMEGEIDTDDLIRFMNTHLSYLQPYFHEWGYIKREALSVRGAVQEAAADAIRASTQEIGICTPFGEEQRRMAVLIIRADPTDRDSGKREYFTDAENRLEGASFLSHDMGFQKYKCVVKAAPILQAAMEYYFNHYQRN